MLLCGKYMVLETHITEIWYLPGNEKNIMCFMHYILFIFAFPKLPLHASISTAILSPYQQEALHVAWEWRFLKQKNVNLEPMKNDPTWQPTGNSPIWNCSFLWFGNISLSLSWFHHPHDLETHLKIAKNCLIWEKKPLI